jgi:hypothetical protein
VNTFEEIFTTNSDGCDRTFTVSIEGVVNDILKHPQTVQVRPTNHSEIAWIVCNLKPPKAAGSNRIQNISLFATGSSQIYGHHLINHLR